MARAKTDRPRGGRVRRRTEEFAVRRWLAAGAASVGLGAALLGLSLSDAQVGVAAADTGDQSSVSSSDRSDDGGAATKDSRTAAKAEADEDNDHEDSDDAGDTDETDAEQADAESAEDDTDEAPKTRKRAAQRAEAVTDKPETTDPEAVSDEPVTFVAPAETSTPSEKLADRKQEDVAKAITALMAAAQSWIAALPVETRVKDDLTATANFLRNTFFNQDPTIDAVQISGQLDGPITGKIDVVDPEGDKVTLRMNRRPQHGTVQLNQDGTYTYTPNAGFTGVDTFAVTAMDSGPHVNVLDLFGRPGSRTGVLVNQGAIKFAFDFVEVGGAKWSDDAKASVRSSADRLVSYFMVAKPVTLTYKMIGEPTGFAAADSPRVSQLPGFHRSVVQTKIITGVDANRSAPDAEMNFNLNAGWSFGDNVAEDKYDFIGTVMHEMLHTFGFGSALLSLDDKPDQTEWNFFDSLIVTNAGRRPFRADSTWDSDYDSYITGGIGSLFFNGANAVKANNGKPVPLYTPVKFDPGTSITHLDDSTYTDANRKIMNGYLPEGVIVRTLAPIELGILADLGYRVVVVASASAA